MRQVLDAKDLTTNEKIYFKGHAKATYLSDGRNVEEAINESPIFEAVYGETTYDEIVNAKNEGKWVICKYDNTQYHLSAIGTISAFFATAEANTNKRVWCDGSTGKWFNAVYKLEETRCKTTSLSSESTDTQYPSAKAVYDFVQDKLGTIINGDY